MFEILLLRGEGFLAPGRIFSDCGKTQNSLLMIRAEDDTRSRKSDRFVNVCMIFFCVFRRHPLFDSGLRSVN